ncbi:MAG: hypothetical protein FJZ01_21935 [Candidatus Sericytochromatia bacterium]|nr:hypothetical protein [Candidatus Tanganyikabacteria bacterium]
MRKLSTTHIGRSAASAAVAGAPIAIAVAIGCVPQPNTSNPTAAPTTAASSTASAAPTTAPTPTATPYSGIVRIPASHKYYPQAYDNCLPCHTTTDPTTGNKIRFMPFPSDHSGRTQSSCTACHTKMPDADPPVIDMTVAKVTTAPDNDPATEDSVWASATQVTIPVKGGVLSSETEFKLKAVHDGTTVYFRMTLADPTESLERQPFVKQADGTWKKTAAWPDKYEDKFSFIWNNPDKPIANFNTQGCAVTCHAVTPSWASNRPLMYTKNTGEYGDMWHAKTARHAAVPEVKLIDDQHVWHPAQIETSGTPTDGDIKAADLIKDGGRKGDGKTETWSGDYLSTPTDASGNPTWMPAGTAVKAPPFWMTATQSFDNTKFNAGDKLASHLSLPMTGSRADVKGFAKWANGVWTYEFKRAMTPTDADKDTKFEAGKTYYMGAAYFDNNQIGHSVQFGVTKVTFAQ